MRLGPRLDKSRHSDSKSMEAVLKRVMPRELVRIVLLDFARRDYVQDGKRIRRVQAVTRQHDAALARVLTHKDEQQATCVYNNWLVYNTLPFLHISLGDFMTMEHTSVYAQRMALALVLCQLRLNYAPTNAHVNAFYRVGTLRNWRDFGIVKLVFCAKANELTFHQLEWILFYGNTVCQDWPSSILFFND